MLPLSLALSLLCGCADEPNDEGLGDESGEESDTPEPVELDELELGIYAVDVHRVNETGCDAEGPDLEGGLDYVVAALHDYGEGKEVLGFFPCASVPDCVDLAAEIESGVLSVDPVLEFETAFSDGTMTGPGRDAVAVPGTLGECTALDEELWLSGFGSGGLEAQSLFHSFEWTVEVPAEDGACIEAFEAGGIEGECTRRVDWRATLVAGDG